MADSVNSDVRLPEDGSDEPAEAVLMFHEQADGRKVARLPGGKVVLLDLRHLDRIVGGERWRVRLVHKETFAIAEPIDLHREPLLPNPVIPAGFQLPRAPVRPARAEAPVPAPAAAPVAPGPPVTRVVPAAPVVPPVPPVVVRAPAPGPEPPRVEAKPVPASTFLSKAANPRDIVRAGDRVAIFIDGANMDGACRSAGYFVDYGKAREYFLGGASYYAGFYYIADFTASDPLQQRYLDFLARAGYIVRRRPVKVIRDHDTGERIIKGNLDTEIVLDMVNTVGNYDVAYLFSGDSDFERAVDLLRSRGKRIYVVTARASLSRELSYVADKPIFFIEEYREVLAREDRGKG